MAALWFGVIQRSLHWSFFISKYFTCEPLLTPQGSIIECDSLYYGAHWDALYQLILQGWEWRVKEHTVQDCLRHGTNGILCTIGFAIQTSDCDMVGILNKFCDWAVEDDLNMGNIFILLNDQYRTIPSLLHPLPRQHCWGRRGLNCLV